MSGERENWYALFVSSGHEEKVKKVLEMTLGEAIEAIVPKRELRERKEGKWTVVTRKLFPGYVLVKGNIDIEIYYKIKSIPMLANFLRDEDGLLTIDEKELLTLNIITNHKDGNLEISKAFKEKNKIRIIDGPLAGLEGYIDSVDTRKGRAKVKIEFLNEIREIQLGIEFVDKI
mgnify:CR=1 FL=1